MGKTDKVSHDTNKILVIVIVILSVAIVIAGIFLMKQYELLSKPNGDLEPNAVVGVMPGKTEEQIKDELNQKVSEKMIAFSINSNPYFESGTSEGTILFENPDTNEKYIKLEIYLDEEEKIIYKTGLMAPGSYVATGTLLQDLDPGEYDCTAYIHAYNLVDNGYIGKAAAGITVTVAS